MDITNHKDILETLKNLKIGETMFIDLDKDFCNVMLLKDLQMQSYNNLFTSYVNNTCEEANKFNLDKFNKKRTDLFTKIRLTRDSIIRIILGEAYKYFWSNPFKLDFDFNLHIIKVMRMEGKK